MTQIRYQLWYRIRRFYSKALGRRFKFCALLELAPIFLQEWTSKNTDCSKTSFTFLNRTKQFNGVNSIDWSFSEYGMLWCYNLNYLDFLLQSSISIEDRNELLNSYLSKIETNAIALSPYPISLRNINLIKYTVVLLQSSLTNEEKQMQIKRINGNLYSTYRILQNNLEYHILANHLLENAFSLLFGSVYLRDNELWELSKSLIFQQLNEQILEDGGHYELSPMYHQILLDRLLDCINILKNNTCFADRETVLQKLEEYAVRMLKWLNIITFNNGSIPLLNDSSIGIAPATSDLNQYANRLNVVSLQDVERYKSAEQSKTLADSGYRKCSNNLYECIVDVGAIGPSYQPGHAHADTFNFVLNVNDKPVIIDPGVSTYDHNVNRLRERGTSLHNTVVVNGVNSSGVWSSFRVAHRANVTITNESSNFIEAKHDGYRVFGAIHKRSWSFTDNSIQIVDEVEGKGFRCKFNLLLSPKIIPVLQPNGFVRLGLIDVMFENYLNISIVKESIPNGYYRYIETNLLVVEFTDGLNTKILINK